MIGHKSSDEHEAYPYRETSKLGQISAYLLCPPFQGEIKILAIQMKMQLN